MKLTLNKFYVKDIQFADESSYKDGVLYICKKELAEYLMEDSNIADVDFDIARPGESVRIIPIKDVIQPRYKQSGTGQILLCGNFRTDCSIPGRDYRHVRTRS